MNGAQVLQLLQALDQAGIRVWIAGGWAVDAMTGRQTRIHGDLDIAADADQLDALLEVLNRDGLRLTTDWLPSRAELTSSDGRTVDVHPVVFAGDGSGVQAGLDGDAFHYSATAFTTGTIEGRTVPCLSVEQQLQFRHGYDLRPEDHHDLALLRRLASGEQFEGPDATSPAFPQPSARPSTPS